MTYMAFLLDSIELGFVNDSIDNEAIIASIPRLTLSAELILQ